MTFQAPYNSPAKEEQTLDKGERTRDRRVFTPLADIYEDEKEIVVVVDVPGADVEAIDLTLEKNVLTIDAAVDRPEPEKHKLSYAEYSYGDYHRSFILSNQIDRDEITADVRNGVLYLHLPKAPEAKSRKITVRSSQN